MADASKPSERIDELTGKLSLDEKLSLLSGADMWTSPGVERLGIPALKVSDGPNGARGGTVPGAGLPAACFPCGSALGATWNPALVERVGAALGEEARSKGAHVLLAPTVNIHRSPLAGRNFECYSEDPLLSSRCAVAFVKGVQSQGVGTSVKHFVCNDSEFERNSISSEVGERALREIYLPPFEAAVREAGAWTVMGAYNRVNGIHACEHPRLLNEILRHEWGFDGVVVSDWFATRSAAPALRAGLDLEMPGPPRRFGDALRDAIQAGELEIDVVDRAVERLLLLRLRTGAFDGTGQAEEQSIDRPEHRELARQAAAESIVLLRNEGSALPLDPARLRQLAVIGPNADADVIQGGGSAQVTPHYAITPLEGIRARCGDRVAVVFERGCTNHKTIPLLDDRFLTPRSGRGSGRLLVEFFADESFSGEALHHLSSRRAELSWFGAPAPEVPDVYAVRATSHFAPPETGDYVFSLTAVGPSRLLVNGRIVVDSWDDPEPGDSFFGAGSAEETGSAALREGEVVDVEIQYRKLNPKQAFGGLRAGCLLPAPDDMLERAVACATRADAAVVIVGLNREWETEGRDRDDLALPGRQAELIERIAAANPRTVVVLNLGSPLEMPWLDDVPAAVQLWYPGQESGNALAAVLFGDRDPAGRLPTSFPRRLEDNPAYLNYPGEAGQVLYGEGIHVGYRFYDAVDREPLFPFGFGLSYTEFEYANLRTSASEVGIGDPVRISLDVRNAGSRRGSEVVQVYVHDVESSLSRPPQELAAFEKLTLEPGESRSVELTLGERALSYYDPVLESWVTEAGEFEVRVGSSSRDIRARTRFLLKE